MTFTEKKMEELWNFIHFIAVIATTAIYMTLGCLHVVVAKSCRVYWFIAKLETSQFLIQDKREREVDSRTADKERMNNDGKEKAIC